MKPANQTKTSKLSTSYFILFMTSFIGLMANELCGENICSKDVYGKDTTGKVPEIIFRILPKKQYSRTKTGCQWNQFIMKFSALF